VAETTGGTGVASIAAGGSDNPSACSSRAAWCTAAAGFAAETGRP
jgi:hypothetical protein